MAYTIYRSDGVAVTVPDNAIDSQFYNPNANGPNIGMGIQLNGRNAIDYGAPTAQTWLQMTENFASNGILPTDGTSLVGQLWFNKSTLSLNVKVTTGSIVNTDNWRKISVINPVVPGNGDIKVDVTNPLAPLVYIFTGITIPNPTGWSQVFPAIYA
jgi:hypothetical protein